MRTHDTPPTRPGGAAPPGAPAPRSGVGPGARYLAPSGRIWTVQQVTPRGGRVILVSGSPDGDVAMVVDLGALARLIPLDDAARPAATSVPPSTRAAARADGRGPATAGLVRS